MAETKPSQADPVEVWITGIGLATSLGEGLDANWDALNQRRINVDEKTFAPYIVHPWTQVNLDTQIPKKGDQRQMEAWQRIGTYAAGLALEAAGIKTVVFAPGPEEQQVMGNDVMSREHLQELIQSSFLAAGRYAAIPSVGEVIRTAAG